MTPQKPHWAFAKHRGNLVQSEPISNEFFSGLSGPADKLVRETIQNSLDARLDSEPARVRFTFSAGASVTPDSRWLSNLAPHLLAAESGVSRFYDPTKSLDTLLIEDYGTCGLTGDPTQTNSVGEWAGQKNNFFYFWRAIGATGKEENRRGSWGLGKSVFPASSQIHTFFGISCEREGGPSRLLGLSVLKTHAIEGSDTVFTPYGYFGLYQTEDSAALPVTDPEEIRTFCRDFGVTREGIPGLSLLVLAPDIFAFSAPTLTASAVVNYFFPILEGQLVVEVLAGEKLTVINATTLNNCVAQIDNDILKSHGMDQVTLEQLIQLARLSVEQRRGSAVRLNAPPEPVRPRWQESLFEVPGFDQAVARFTKGEAVEFVVPVSVTTIKGQVEEAEFCVSLQKSPNNLRSKALFIRDGITVSGVAGPSGRGLVALTTVESDALAKFLRLSEDPSHSEWREKGSKLVDHYEKPALLLRYVKNGVSEIHERLSRTKEGIDSDLLADLFYIEQEEGPKLNTVPGKSPQTSKVPQLEAEEQPVRVSVRQHGIKVTGVFGVAKIGQVFRVRFAYDVRRGNPFNKWSQFDFDLAELKSLITWDGVQRLYCAENTLGFYVEKSDFEIFLAGLDPLRDIRVEVTEVRNP